MMDYPSEDHLTLLLRAPESPHMPNFDKLGVEAAL